jgi:hypothetical protein
MEETWNAHKIWAETPLRKFKFRRMSMRWEDIMTNQGNTARMMNG